MASKATHAQVVVKDAPAKVVQAVATPAEALKLEFQRRVAGAPKPPAARSISDALIQWLNEEL